MTTPEQILEFWFGDKPNTFRREWFQKNPAFDEEIRHRFGAIYREAVDGSLGHWTKTPLHSLALVILLDQFPRNMFRGDPRAFGSDSLALGYTSAAIRQGFDHQVSPVQRSFFYLPFEHSEKLVHQKTSVRLFRALERQAGMKDTLTYAIKHQDIIKKFRRFPHRNSVLQRASSSREQSFLSKIKGF